MGRKTDASGCDWFLWLLWLLKQDQVDISNPELVGRLCNASQHQLVPRIHKVPRFKYSTWVISRSLLQFCVHVLLGSTRLFLTWISQLQGRLHPSSHRSHYWSQIVWQQTFLCYVFSQVGLAIRMNAALHTPWLYEMAKMFQAVSVVNSCWFLDALVSPRYEGVLAVGNEHSDSSSVLLICPRNWSRYPWSHELAASSNFAVDTPICQAVEKVKWHTPQSPTRPSLRWPCGIVWLRYQKAVFFGTFLGL